MENKRVQMLTSKIMGAVQDNHLQGPQGLERSLENLSALAKCIIEVTNQIQVDVME
jgi:hypothetical protein